MRVPPLAIGMALGLGLAAALVPAAGNALASLAQARRAKAATVAQLAALSRPSAPLVAAGMAARNAGDAEQRIRARAREAGVLVEALAPDPGEGALLRLRLAASGSEKAVIGFADAIERDPVLMRFDQWRIEAIEDGVRISGTLVAARQ